MYMYFFYMGQFVTSSLIPSLPSSQLLYRTALPRLLDLLTYAN